MATLEQLLSQILGIPAAEAAGAGDVPIAPPRVPVGGLSTPAPLMPTDFAAGNELNERQAVPDAPGAPAASQGGGLGDLLSRILSSITGSTRPPEHRGGIGSDVVASPPPRPNKGSVQKIVPDTLGIGSDFVASPPPPPPVNPPLGRGGIGSDAVASPPVVPPFSTRTQVATDQDAALAETIMRGAEQAQAARAAANPWSSENAGNTFLTILARALQGLGSIDDPSKPGLIVAGKGAAGAINAGVAEQDRALRRKMLEQQTERAGRAEARAERADQRAERADTRAQEVHRLNVMKLADEIRRRIGGNLTPEQMLRVDQIAATLFRSSRTGAVKQATDQEVIDAFTKYRENILGRYTQSGGGLPAPQSGLPAPRAPAARAPAAAPAARTPQTDTPRAAAPPAVREGTTARNPTTGQRLIFKDGKWQPL